MSVRTSDSLAEPPMRVAYLGPEIPALSATFIYEELLGLERRGLSVHPFSVRRPGHLASDQGSLVTRTQVLYDRSAAAMVLDGLLALPRFGPRVATALGWLARDMARVGLHRAAAWKLAYQWLMGARLGRALQRAACTHLHVHFVHTPTQIAMYASAFTGIPFTVMAHANDIFERALLLPDKARRSRKLLTISGYNRDYLRSVGVPDDKLAVVRCGVSFDAREQAPPFEQRLRYRVGTLGRLVEKKGVDDLLRAAAMLRDAPWALEISVVGDGPLRERLTALARELGLEDSVQFVGALGHDAVAAWMRSLDVFALACKKDSNGDMDGIPLVLMEAMTQRVPVISTRLSGIPELVVHERTGLLAAPGDPAALAQQLRRLLDAPELRSRLSDAAVHHVQDEFGQATNLDRLVKYFMPAAAQAA